MSLSQKRIDKIVYAWLKPLVPEDIQKLINIATFDVLNGPFTEADCEGDLEGYPGYAAAQGKIQAFLDGFPHKIVWVDVHNECVFEKEPEGYWTVGEEDAGEDDESGRFFCEPDWDDIYTLEQSDLKKFILGTTLNSQG